MAKSKRSSADVLARRLEAITGTTNSPPDVASASRASRDPAFKPATLTLITGGQLDVVIKNLSPTGAKIAFVQKVRLPDRVMLSEPSVGIRTWAYVAWQTRGEAGLEFVETETTPADDHA